MPSSLNDSVLTMTAKPVSKFYVSGSPTSYGASGGDIYKPDTGGVAMVKSLTVHNFNAFDVKIEFGLECRYGSNINYLTYQELEIKSEATISVIDSHNPIVLNNDSYSNTGTGGGAVPRALVFVNIAGTGFTTGALNWWVNAVEWR